MSTGTSFSYFHDSLASFNLLPFYHFFYCSSLLFVLLVGHYRLAGAEVYIECFLLASRYFGKEKSCSVLFDTNWWNELAKAKRSKTSDFLFHLHRIGLFV